ncbi:lipoxygenase 2.3, chloroplastic-like [Oryza brachyantha]|uniref:lipoxygenase 2.3, chloroplastic-like n=1 Tax=Oryza brachyantha TaxID=4533 RepID=UPI001ADAC81A|nr:lipoxygenase 2.3, chloroplastic-like [Oryza brachyantha]
MAAPARPPPSSAALLSANHGSACRFTATVSASRAPAAAVNVVHSRRRSGTCARRWITGARRRATELSRIRCSAVDGGRGGEATSALAAVTAVEQDHAAVITMKATVTAKAPAGARGLLSHVGVDGVRDDIADFTQRSLFLELVSSELEPKTGEEKSTISGYAHVTRRDGAGATYEATFAVPASFGPVGAVLVENEHHREMFLRDIVLTDGGSSSSSAAVFECNSWVHSKFDDSRKRAFFPLKSYLPSRTPQGVARLRNDELAAVRGDGHGERRSFERVYDYDVYNDLGNPDADPATKRPVLGGKDHPYPRRCRTGRPRSKKDPSSEKRSSSVYVPRDEVFSEVKSATFSAMTLRSAMHAVVPSIETALVDAAMGFPHFAAIDALFDDGIKLPGGKNGLDRLLTLVPRLIKAAGEVSDFVLRFETPEMIDRDKFAWFRDEEFARQTLAGLNPLSIQLVTELPITSKLDEEIYGSPDSLIIKELIEERINGAMTAQEALESKKLFMLDYHDLFLPYVNKVRELDGTTLYGSRTLFFLTGDGTLNPIAIELTRPKSPARPQWRQVFTHRCDATGSWLWKLAKAHVLAHDSGYHQLVSHWLRTHCCVEPYIIAANRRLSRMHPVHRLLRPHFRYTMEINALAREFLVSAGGIIESSFSPGRYSMELSSAVYDALWRFDMEALPADLIRRGMAAEGDDGELVLAIEDYPYANDGLLVWESIKEWASDYVRCYYSSAEEIAGDEELQGWWTEVRTKGHADKKDEPWWPVLDSHQSLVQVLTTIMWVTSGHHAAVNFGQYHFAGYFPNRPTIARRNMPVEEGVGGREMEAFLARPEETLLGTFPSQIQAAVVMTVLDILSAHSPDEEYMGARAEAAWAAEPMALAAFERFSGRMKEIEGIVDERNAREELRNRCGAGVVPYELLKPFSGAGVTGRGIPNSISI